MPLVIARTKRGQIVKGRPDLSKRELQLTTSAPDCPSPQDEGAWGGCVKLGPVKAGLVPAPRSEFPWDMRCDRLWAHSGRSSVVCSPTPCY